MTRAHLQEAVIVLAIIPDEQKSYNHITTSNK